MKKILWFVILLVFLLPLIASLAHASLQIWPGKLTISMQDGYPTERISYHIQVRNPYTYVVNASAQVENPNAQQITTNYSYIPNLSWVTVEPETLYLPANTSGNFEIFLDIPESERSNYYNKSWETCIVISSDRPAGAAEGLVFQIDIAVKLFIHTPPGEKGPTVGMFFILGVIIAAGVTVILFRYARKNIPEK